MSNSVLLDDSNQHVIEHTLLAKDGTVLYKSSRTYGASVPVSEIYTFEHAIDKVVGEMYAGGIKV